MLAFALVATLAVTAQQAPQEPARNGSGGGGIAPAIAVRAAQPPELDGRDDDPIWQTATKVSAFREFDPNIDAEPSMRTEFQVVYDERNLYVFTRMYDPHPDSIMHALTRRDVRGPSDQIKLLIDSYDDKRTGFEFAVNPDGVKRDYAMFNDGVEDISWNGVWDVATAVDEQGWTAEFRIPLSQLRYADAPTHTFGFGVWRDIERHRERVSWPVYSPTTSGLSSQLGRLEGLADISGARRVEVTPYALTKNVQRALTAPTTGFERVQQYALGGDLKVGLTPNITLDATVNPDFGQVEADPAVLNLTAFETFFPERRPFFIEGTGLYQFQLNCYIVVDCSTNEGLFYSRRIGRAPQLLQSYGDATTATATPIAAAAKLTGRTRNGLSFGLVDAFTRREAGSLDRTVEPRTNYAVFRARQDLRAGATDIGVIATGVNRSLDSWTDAFLHESAYAAGASFRHQFLNRNYQLVGQLTASRVTGTAAAIARTQRSPVHYYQQPGDEPEVDPTRTSLTGHGEQIKIGKYGGGIARFETSLLRQSTGLEVNDLGFLRRADILDWSTWASLNFREPRGIYRWFFVNGNHWQHWNTSGTRLENAVNFNAHMGTTFNWDFHGGGTLGRLTESYCDRCTRGGPPLRQTRGFFPWFGVNTDSRKLIAPSMWVNLGYWDEGRSRNSSLSPSVNLNLATSLQANVGASFSREENNTQWYSNITDEGGTTHHVFARLEQRTVSMNTRINYAATPDLTFEFYGQPFVAKGRYSDVREVSATPDAPDYDARFRPYTLAPNASTEFHFAQLRTNAVLRWEFRPGSTLFLVWAHGKQDRESVYTERSWTSDYRELFSEHPDNTFLIKLAYWLAG
jgi:hypothetical protein